MYITDNITALFAFAYYLVMLKMIHTWGTPLGALACPPGVT